MTASKPACLIEFLNQYSSGGDYEFADAWLSACLRDFADFIAEVLLAHHQRRRAIQRQSWPNKGCRW